MQRTKSGECPHDALTMDEFWHLTWTTVNALYKTILLQYFVRQDECDSPLESFRGHDK